MPQFPTPLLARLITPLFSLLFIAGFAFKATPQRATPSHSQAGRLLQELLYMLWTIFVILLLGWLIGWIGFHVVAWTIHLLLVAAIVVLIIRLVQGRRVVP